MKQPIYCLNGKFVPKSKALLPVTDLAIQRGFGIFEAMRTYNGKIFCLDKHLQRLFDGAKLVNFTLPFSQKYLIQKVRQTLVKNNFNESIIKVIVTGGVSKDLFLPSGKPNFCILVEPQLFPPPKEFYKNGVKIITVQFTRSFPTVKSINYFDGILAKIKAEKEGAVEALYVTLDNHLLEGVSSNFFLVKNGSFITPKDNILSGVTRNYVISLANKLGYKVLERTIKLSGLKKAQEAFLTSTNREIMPVVKVDEIKIGNGKPGPVTLKLLEEFRKSIYNTD